MAIDPDIGDLDRRLARIVGSRPWRLLLGLRTRRPVTTAVVTRLVEVARVWHLEGWRGVAARIQRRIRPMPGRPRPPLQATSALPQPIPPIDVPAMTDPRGVSIVVSVSDDAVATYGCLRALVEGTPPGRYELIVVDNAAADATDATGAVLASTHGIRLVRNAARETVLEARNQGAQAAKGEFLVFLDGGVQPLDGWLPPMVELLARDPGIGAVAAQLLQPDGRLQEAGGIVWSDGTALSYGHGDDPDRPEHRYLREVDYCSGPGLLLRRDLFERLGRLDPRYASARYAFADLCFKLRDGGGRIVYQPRARLRGAGAMTTDAVEGQDVHDRDRGVFAEAHVGALAMQQASGPGRTFRARDRRGGLRLLFVDHMVPLHDQDSGSVRMRAILDILVGLGHAVTFIPDNLDPVQPYTELLQQIGVEVLYGRRSIPQYIEEHLGDFDVLVLCRAPVAIRYMPGIVARPDRPAVIFDTVDLHHLREQRQAALTGDPRLARDAAVTREIELYLTDVSDAVWVVSTYEATVLRRERPEARIEVMPNVHAVREHVPPLEGRKDLLFIGGFWHQPNEDAVLYFADAVLPLITEVLPDVRLIVVGSHLPPSIEALASPNVVPMGYVPDVDPVFDGCRVFVAPLRYGAGTKGKIGQSLACGLPVVTTSVGSEGMGLTDGDHALIADTAPDFAARVIQLYGDASLWMRLSARGRQHVEALFGYETARARLEVALHDASTRHRRRRTARP
jgi:glycosyltransferase involved in cell wall biosynthesis